MPKQRDQNKETKLISTVEKVRQETSQRTRLGGVPYCDAKQAADYLLAFSNMPVKAAKKGICYYSFNIPLNLSSNPVTKNRSVNQDGIFLPLTSDQRKNLDNALKQLSESGIPIEQCEQDFQQSFQENDSYFKWVFYSYDTKSANPNQLDVGQAFDIHVPESDTEFHFIGIRRRSSHPHSSLLSRKVVALHAG